MIKPFEYYLNENLVRKSTPNISLAKALLLKSEIRLKKIGKLEIEEDESSIVFEDIYESLREAAQSLMEINGYKPYSHEALISFLKEKKLLPIEKITILDTYRIIRNNSVYKAEEVSLEKCNEALKFAEKILPEINKVFANLTNR